MIQLGVLLMAGGVAGALWRDYRKKQAYKSHAALPYANPEPQTSKLPPPTRVKVFDDVGELNHYQKISWYALAFAASGSWFYPPARLVSLPLLSYNTYHFFRTIRQSDKADQKSPVTLFESIGIAGSLATGSPFTASMLMVFSFGTRKLLLQAGNISNNIGFSQPFNPRYAKVWVMRDGAELETTVGNLREDDVIVLHAGDTIALEGKVLDGVGSVRQFSLRKQMKLIPKQEGDRVYPFTQLESGCLHVQAV
ncbi:hypothetical protein VSS37_09770 [Candidatus Thiothrix sp. Deng01]|uniref:P-type ATPase A domain-containing protein n=1 Tax=Candidatus Thiothrix phosphatis TaxID=3112415 RepID=A0ABU6CWR0_9GAMM|nr:hypothetical protein [Candidatus Thiothrix sp. Deng01]MEB4591264.1 hypothetical protein [Candidatus Thiothrix sp. Deng01]